MICYSYIAIEWIVCLGKKYNSLFNPEFRIVTSPAFEDCLKFLAIPQFIRSVNPSNHYPKYSSSFMSESPKTRITKKLCNLFALHIGLLS